MNQILDNMKNIVIQINNCKTCPFFKTGNYYSSDGFDRMEDWICTKLDKKIQGGVEWHEENKIAIPDWCPISLDNIKEDSIKQIYYNMLNKFVQLMKEQPTKVPNEVPEAVKLLDVLNTLEELYPFLKLK